MSWSINLNGPQAVVQREIADALLLLDKAFDWVEKANDSNDLSVNLSGYVSWDLNRDITNSSVAFSVGESAPSKPSSHSNLAHTATEPYNPVGAQVGQAVAQTQNFESPRY